jgi:hypothetical protein
MGHCMSAGGTHLQSNVKRSSRGGWQQHRAHHQGGVMRAAQEKHSGSGAVPITFRASNQTGFPFRLVIVYTVCSKDGTNRREKCSEITVIPTLPQKIEIEASRVERVCIVQAWEMCVLEGPFEVSEMEASVSISFRLQSVPVQHHDAQSRNSGGVDVAIDEHDWQRQCGTILLCKGMKGSRRLWAHSSVHHHDGKITV